ncbi:MAG: DMT family transporter [Chloroflexi bacterium]|nr:DMT family transporter [Chloroflexota bacterium]
MTSSDSRPISPQVVLFIGILAVSASSIFIRFAQAGAPSLVVAAYRMMVAGLVLAPVALPSRRTELRNLSRREVGLALFSGLLLAVHFATWIQSLEMTSVASSVVLVTTSPLWLAILAHLLLGERLARKTIMGLLVALVGGVIMALTDSCQVSGAAWNCPPIGEFVRGEAFLGNLLALIGAWSGAGYFLIGRRLRPHLSLTSYIFLVYGVSGLLLTGMVLLSGLPLFGYSSQTYFWMVLLALVPQILGHSSFNWALGHLPAAYISLPLLGEPVGTIILAYFILNETPGSFKLIGAALILAGILLGSRGSRGQEVPQV